MFNKQSLCQSWLAFALILLSLPFSMSSADAAITSKPTSDLLEPRIGHTATMLMDGSVLVAGGIRGGGQATAEVYNPVSDTWIQVGSLNVARGEHSAVLLPDGKVLVAGGYSQITAINSAEIYDPATQSWQPTSNLNSSRNEHSMTLLANGTVMVIGGYSSDDEALNSAEIYDPALGTWQIVGGKMLVPRYDHTATRLADNRIMVVGGLTDHPTEGEIAVESVEIFDPATGQWQITGSMTGARYSHTATLLQSGMVFVVGGHNGISQLSTTELYDPASGTWQPRPNLNTARSGHTASLVAGDALLLVGGLDNGGRLAKNEIYLPTENHWQVTGDLNIARNGHTSTILSRNLILVAGGSATNGATLSSVELYNPGVELIEDPIDPDRTTPVPQPNRPQERSSANDIFIPLVQR